VDHILSVCTGIGGLDLGLHAGLRAVGRSPRTVCMVEREAFTVAVLGKAMQEGRLDACPVWCGDLADLPTADLPRVDWYTGGYPCQPFSSAGKRRGADDRRHLWPVIAGQLKALRPRGVFFENVAGHLTLGLRDVLADLEELGFRCAFGLYSASEIGAPHRRERVFILGLADADGERGRGGDQQRQDAEDARQSSRHSWPSRPGNPQRCDEPSRTVEPRLGRNADGVSDRVDRLRALGNAVVPQQAELAFIRLWNLLQETA